MTERDRSRSCARLPGITAALTADLAELSADHSIAPSISMLSRDLGLAVRSFLGFTLTVLAPPPTAPVAINVVDAPVFFDDVADRLTIHVPTLDTDATTTLTIYSGRPQALDQLRIDLHHIVETCPETGRAPRPTGPVLPGITGLAAHAYVHRAIGVLLAGGHSLHTARLELFRQAQHTSDGLAGAAQNILDAASLTT